MRICDVNNFYSPTGGGVRTYHERKLDFFAEDAERGDAYALVVPSDRQAITRRRAGAMLVELPARKVGDAGYRAITHSRDLAGFFADFAPDLVEIGSPYLMPWLVRRALPRPTATVGFVHADYPDTYVEPALRGAFSGLLRPLAAPAARLAGHHMAHTYGWMSASFGASAHVLRKLRRLGLRRLFHTPCGVEAQEFSATRRDLQRRRQLGIADDERLLLFLGRLSGEKGVDLLLDAWPRLAGRPGLRLVIAGHGPREAEVDALVARDPSVIRLAHVEGRREVAAWMASADLFLALGAYETFSLTTLEALACGTAVLAPDSGGAAELIQNFAAGSTFARGDPAALAAAIVDAAPLRPSQAARLRARIESDYTWPAACARIRDAYERVLMAHQSGALDGLEAPGGWWPAQMSPPPAADDPKFGASV